MVHQWSSCSDVGILKSSFALSCMSVIILFQYDNKLPFTVIEFTLGINFFLILLNFFFHLLPLTVNVPQVVYAKTDIKAGSKGITAFIIEKGMPGYFHQS